MKKFVFSKVLGALLYIGVWVIQCIRAPEILLKAPYPPLLGLLFVSIVLLTWKEQKRWSTGFGLALLSAGLLSLLDSLQVDTRVAHARFPLTGLMVLVGGILLGRSRQWDTWKVYLLGWGGLGLAWLALRIPFGSLVLACYGICVLIVHAATLRAETHTSKTS